MKSVNSYDRALYLLLSLFFTNLALPAELTGKPAPPVVKSEFIFATNTVPFASCHA
jgi:hypothetical protein